MIDLSKIEILTKNTVNNNGIIIKYTDKSYFVGDNDMKYGKYFGNKFNYYGYWNDNKPNDNGFLINKKNNTKYDGNILNGYPNGIGKEIYKTGYYYKGEFVKGKKHGVGSLMFKDIIIYNGIWFQDNILFNNEFKEIFDKNGYLKYKTNKIEFNNDTYSINGYAIEYYKGKIKYEGEFTNNEYDGFGKLYLITEKYNGKSVDIIDHHLVYEGNFENNRFSGKGTLYNDDNTIYYVGTFKDNLISDSFIKVSGKNYYFEGLVSNIKYSDRYRPILNYKEGIYINYLTNLIFKGDFENIEINNISSHRLASSSNKCYIEKILERDNRNIINKKSIFEGNIIDNEFNGFIEIKENKFEGKFIINNYNIKLNLDNIININYKEGILYDLNNKKISEGIYRGKLLNGQGKIYKNGILLKSGYFVNNILNGIGISYYKKWF